MIVGLTGKFCAGKNAVANVLAERGWRVIDEDSIGHEALSAKRDAIVEAFGEEILDSSGGISRPELGRLVFARPELLKLLESIVHPWMVGKTKEMIGTDEATDVVINAAVLFKMGLHELCDYVVIVKALLPQRILRCMRRDHLSLRRIVNRLQSQRGLNKAPENVDIVTVWNTGSTRRLRRRVERILLS